MLAPGSRDPGADATAEPGPVRDGRDHAAARAALSPKGRRHHDRIPAAGPGDEASPADTAGRPQPGVLATRIAATLVHESPGWRLPRLSVLARHYRVSEIQLGKALEELASTHLITRLPDGQLRRACPADYLLPLAGQPGLRARIDLLAGELTCLSTALSRRRIREEHARMLGHQPGEPACVLRTAWAVDGEPAAVATTCVADPVAGQVTAAAEDGDLDSARAALPLLPPVLAGFAAESPEHAWSLPAELYVEMQQPSPWAARTLELPASQLAIMVCARFDDPATGQPAALTAAVLRPDLFRVIISSADPPLPGGGPAGLPASWEHVPATWA